MGSVGPVVFISNPDQTQMNEHINVFRITRLPAGAFFF